MKKSVFEAYRAFVETFGLTIQIAVGVFLGCYIALHMAFQDISKAIQKFPFAVPVELAKSTQDGPKPLAVGFDSVSVTAVRKENP